MELVERYRAGALQRDLANEFGVERRTAMEIIKRHGAQRKLGLSDAQVEEAAQRYASGESLATIGRALGVHAETVRLRLRQSGVTLRPTSVPKFRLMK